jgi:hypothetical protein
MAAAPDAGSRPSVPAEDGIPRGQADRMSVTRLQQACASSPITDSRASFGCQIDYFSGVASPEGIPAATDRGVGSRATDRPQALLPCCCRSLRMVGDIFLELRDVIQVRM